jgi:hypothetical protein
MKSGKPSYTGGDFSHPWTVENPNVYRVSLIKFDSVQVPTHTHKTGSIVCRYEALAVPENQPGFKKLVPFVLINPDPGPFIPISSHWHDNTCSASAQSCVFERNLPTVTIPKK